MLDLQLNIINDINNQSFLRAEDQKKIDRYFSSFDYLNDSSLRISHLQKIRHVGIDSLKQGSLFIQQVSDYIINEVNHDFDLINTNATLLHEIISKFELKDRFFSRKTNVFQLYSENKRNVERLNSQFEDLIKKLHSHLSHFETFEHTYQNAIYLLNRDIYLLSKFAAYIDHKSELKEYVVPFAKELELISKNIINQQQLVIQKKQFLNTIKDNVSYYIQNIQYISNVTVHMISGMVELEILNKLPKSDINTNQEKAQRLFTDIQKELNNVLIKD